MSRQRARAVFLRQFLLQDTPSSQVPRLLIKRCILRNGTLEAVLLVLAATLANHVRRLLVPWLGQFVWWHALENMRFARSSPHYFLEHSVHFSWGEVTSWLCGSVVVAVARVGNRNAMASFHGHKGGLLCGRREAVLGMCTVVDMAMGLTLLERYYTQTCFSAACVYALFRVVEGGPGRAFLWDLVSEEWLRAGFQCVLVLCWACGHLLPTAWKVSRAMVAGKMVPAVVHGVVWGGTAYLVRYSNKYFILLELSDLLVTLGWMALGLGTVLLLRLEILLHRRDAPPRGYTRAISVMR
ncbi:hypothetical protein ED733_007678 [Metarhizium rileyi]|uniref:Uncharacterized protein n=1 Tax=Metarhizium rileyi (strain RCEF 4871) TaxID=1649241 RepID=A0A5C6GIF3_METRR|nr:hypothetical protein ED733_007678 [Metarhizium rileyi]